MSKLGIYSFSSFLRFAPCCVNGVTADYLVWQVKRGRCYLASDLIYFKTEGHEGGGISSRPWGGHCEAWMVAFGCMRRSMANALGSRYGVYK